MRVGYLIVGVGLAVVKWPVVIDYDGSMPLFEGLSLFSSHRCRSWRSWDCGIPVRLLPILLFECAWKLIWLAVVALPAVAAGDVDEATQEVIFSCSLVVIILAVVPWRYV